VKTDLLLQSHQRIVGLGIEQFGGLFSAKYSVHALFTMNLYDGQNFALLAKHPAATGRTFVGTPQLPFRSVDETWWPESNAAQNAKLRDGARGLVEQSLDLTLPEFLRSN
jgi:hypothetical protein